MEGVPNSMMAWTKVRGGQDGFELIEHPVPVPKPNEVLVKTFATSICGTDLHIWKWDDWSESNVPLGTITCLLYTSPSPRDVEESRMPSSA